MRILITGASGLLGLNLALEYAREHAVTGVTHSHPVDLSRAGGAWAAQARACEIIQMDLQGAGTDSSLERLLANTRPDWVIHCAALAKPDACEADPARAQALNAELPARLARLAAERGTGLVHISTDAVFDGQRGGYTEEDAPHPLSVYAQTKLEGEQAVLEADPQAIVARVNLFGWSMDGKRSLAEFFLNNLRDQKPVQGFSDVYICPLLVNDLAGILLKMIDRGLHGLYHVVSSESLSKYQFGAALARRFGFDQALIRPASVREAGLKARRSPLLTLKTDKLASALGEPLPGFGPALERFYALYRQGYPEFLRALGQPAQR